MEVVYRRTMRKKFEVWGLSDGYGMARNEVLVVGFILFVIWGLAGWNFRISQVRARDVQRKNDLKHVVSALGIFLKDNGYYPPSKDGRIAICGSIGKLASCEWGSDGIKNLQEFESSFYYINPLPEDPLEPGGKFRYVYVSDTRDFQLFASLENPEEPEYNKKVFEVGILCGVNKCNFGIASSKEWLSSLIDEVSTVDLEEVESDER